MTMSIILGANDRPGGQVLFSASRIFLSLASGFICFLPMMNVLVLVLDEIPTLWELCTGLRFW